MTVSDVIPQADRAARPWLSAYPSGVRATLPEVSPATLAAFAREGAKRFAEKPAFSVVLPNGMTGTLTFAQIDRMSDAFAAHLRETLGLAAGDRVAIQVPNCLSYPIAAFGVFKAGCVLVNVNPLYTAEEMGHQFADSTPRALVILDMFADKLPAALSRGPIEHVIVARVAEFLPPLQRTLVGLVQRYVKKDVKPVPVKHGTFAAALKDGEARLGGAKLDAYVAGVTPDSVACLQYTGGTTGVSKGAMLTHRNLVTNVAQTCELVGQEIKEGVETVMTVLPLYHIFAFTVSFLAFWTRGGHNVLIPNPRPLTNLKPAFEKFPVTWLPGVNTLFNGLPDQPWFRDAPPKSLRYAVAGGMALQGRVAERWTETTGTPVIEGYGLTESSPVLTFNPFGRAKLGSIGVPLPSTDIRCVDDEGKPVPQGEPGEIAAKGPQIMLGYWNKPAETAKTMRDGWLLTGDVGIMDADGYVRIVDRKKDMILVSGFNVYPNEIEDVLVRHPAVIEAAVVGVPDGASGEAVKAFVVRRNEEVGADELRAFAREHLTGYKVPKHFEFRGDLPKTNVGKVLRKSLREPASAGS